MKTAVKSVEEYLSNVPEPALSTLQKVRSTIRATLPAEAVEVISYGMPAFRHLGKGVMAYAAFAKHCSLFPMSATTIAAHAADLQNYQTSKGTIQFPVHKPLPAVLIRKLLRTRLAEITRAK